MENAIAPILDFAQPKEVKSILWVWFRATVVGNYNNLPKPDKDSIACLFELLDDMFTDIQKGIEPDDPKTRS